jgi:preprotein translocase subunit SecA
LLCTSLGILIATMTNKPVTILGKLEYLPHRDHKKLKEMVRECGVEYKHNNFQTSGITFMDLKQLDILMKDPSKARHLVKSILLIDEYDWLIFDDAKPSAISERIEKLKLFDKVIGFSGSKLNKDEEECLVTAFGIKVSTFPLMTEMNKNLIIRYDDIVETNIKAWKEAILNKACEFATRVPVIIVVGSRECESLAKLFNGLPCTDLSKLNKHKTLADL